MAISKVETFGLLHQWRAYNLELEGMFNQVKGTGVPLRAHDSYMQETRDLIARSINQAFTPIKDVLGYAPVPVYEVNETVRITPRYPITSQVLETKYAYLSAIGARSVSEIESGAAYALSKSPATFPVDNRVTITVTLAGDNIGATPDEIHVFFRVADGGFGVAHPQSRIEPLNVSISGNEVTITGSRWLFVRPDTVWFNAYGDDVNQLTRRDADPNESGDFVTAIDVYRVTTDATGAVSLNANPEANGGTASETVIARIVNPELGTFRITQTPSLSAIENVTISYRAGYPLDSFGNPDVNLTTAVMRFANATMPTLPESLDPDHFLMWLDDRAKGEDAPIPPGLVNNPFGVEKGAFEAFKVANSRRIGARDSSV